MKKHLILSVVALLAFASIASAQSYTFSNDLYVGNSGQDVAALQAWLIGAGYSIPALSSGASAKGYFGQQTKTALVSYQRAAGLPPTGFFGPMTRGRLNSGQGGPIAPPVVPPQKPAPQSNAPVISGLDTPTTIAVGQMGTWSVHASDPQGSALSYSIDWGDSPAVPAGYTATMAAPQFTQSASFTHTYSAAGTYTIRATVQDALGLTAQTSVTVLVTGGNTASPLRVISPNGGESWLKGTLQNIQWSAPHYYSDGVTVDIKLTRQVVCAANQACPMIVFAPITIAMNIPISQNTYSWSVGTAFQAGPSVYNAAGASGASTDIPAGQYSVQICQTGTSLCASSNATFNLVVPTVSAVPDINVVSPNGGQVWLRGTPQTVTVDVSGDPQLVGKTAYLYLIDSVNKQYPLATVNITATGPQSFQVQVPTYLTPSSNYRVYVTLYNGSVFQAYDYSDGSVIIGD